MIDRSRKVVLLVDYGDLQASASRSTPSMDLQLEPVIQLAQRYGTVMAARAYAEWSLPTERLAVYRAGMEPAFAPVLRTESDRMGKSLVDTLMVVEAMDMLWTLQPDVFVFATSDKDLIPLVRVARRRGVHVVILGSELTPVLLREIANLHLTYKQLVTEGATRAVDDAAISQAPAFVDPRPTSRQARTSRAVRAPRSTESSPSQLPSTEPIAPISTDADGTLAGRRRRRPGSRHRTGGLIPDGDISGSGDGELADNSASLLEMQAVPVADGYASRPDVKEAMDVEESGASVLALPLEETPAATPFSRTDIETDGPPARLSPSDRKTAPLDGEVPSEETAVGPTMRTRRVAGAARGRTRSSDRG